MQQFAQPPMTTQQQVKFYKSGFLGFSSAAGRFQRDQQRMAAQGWKVREMAFLGTNFFLQRVVSVVYEM